MGAAASCLVPENHPSSCRLLSRYRGLSDAIIILRANEMIGKQANLVNTKRCKKEMYL